MLKDSNILSKSIAIRSHARSTTGNFHRSLPINAEGLCIDLPKIDQRWATYGGEILGIQLGSTSQKPIFADSTCAKIGYVKSDLNLSEFESKYL